MKKWVILVLVLILAGCIPRVEDISEFKQEKKEIFAVRGLNFELVKPRFRFEDNERTLKAGSYFDVSLKLSHSLIYNGVNGDISVKSSASDVRGSKLIKSENSFSIDKANLEGNVVEPKYDLINFGSFSYGQDMKGEVDSLNFEMNTMYNGLVISDLCFDKGKVFGCKNEETLSGNKLKGDNEVLPLAIDRIEKFVDDVGDSGADFDLVIYLKNFGKGYVSEIGSFNADLRDGSINCGEVSFQDDMWRVDCSGSKNFGWSPISFEFDYLYIISEVIAFRVV